MVVMGVSGAGKSTVAAALADRLGWPLEEGDDLHPAANVAKMHAGTPLTDEDRAPWLGRVAAWIDDRIEAGEPGVISCSALRRRYRDVLRRPEVVFAHLEVPEVELRRRLELRRGHFMPASLLQSQLAAIELPGPDEAAITIDGRLAPSAQAAALARAVAPDQA